MLSIIRGKIIIESFFLTLLLGIISFLGYLFLPKVLYLNLITITALSTAPVHGVYKKPYLYILISIALVTISLIIGVSISSWPDLIPLSTIAMGTLAVYLPTRYAQTPEILTKFCFIAYISSALGHNSTSISNIFIASCITTIIVMTYYLITNKLLYKKQNFINQQRVLEPYHHTLYIAIISLIIGYFITKVMLLYLPNTSSWWILMTIVLVLGFSYEKIKKTAIKRGLANIIGPVLIVILMIPIKEYFYLQIALLFILFFLVNSLISYYLLLSLFVSCMIISWHIIMSSPQQLYSIALSRLFETLIAVCIVLVVSWIYKKTIFRLYKN